MVDIGVNFGGSVDIDCVSVLLCMLLVSDKCELVLVIMCDVLYKLCFDVVIFECEKVCIIVGFKEVMIWFDSIVGKVFWVKLYLIYFYGW